MDAQIEDAVVANFDAEPLPLSVIRSSDPLVLHGHELYQERACVTRHLVEGHGGRRGPDLTLVADRLTDIDLVIRILNGGVNMPAYGNMMPPLEVDALMAYLKTRRGDIVPRSAVPFGTGLGATGDPEH